MIPPRIKGVKILDDYLIEIFYANGEKKLYDFKKNLSANYYSKLNNIDYFKLAKSAETTIEWPRWRRY